MTFFSWEVTAGLAESNGSLLLVEWLKKSPVGCLPVHPTPGSALGPKLGNEYGITLNLLFTNNLGNLNISQSFIKDICDC